MDKSVEQTHRHPVVAKLDDEDNWGVTVLHSGKSVALHRKACEEKCTESFHLTWELNDQGVTITVVNRTYHEGSNAESRDSSRTTVSSWGAAVDWITDSVNM
jgi:hypothetical protein